jgi:hypothetical protein
LNIPTNVVFAMEGIMMIGILFGNYLNERRFVT